MCRKTVEYKKERRPKENSSLHYTKERRDVTEISPVSLKKVSCLTKTADAADEKSRDGPVSLGKRSVRM